ncbi:hypothetical protein HanPI659440_Chr14g0549561 [Helianthus annuus]|nr:hypothetical protein HanPI659440_Chr14g0549561 [Helianthus annuus]
MELIETFIHVCIIYDPSKSNKGALAFKALLFSASLFFFFFFVFLFVLAELNRDLEDTST